MRIDLGSGRSKHANCIGIDRVGYKGTDLIHDFNLPIPLADSSVDFVMASNSLCYVDNLQQVMAEIYRVCRHSAVVVIVAPYAHATASRVNPEYKQQFDEHLPKYWTAHPDDTLYADEFPLTGPQARSYEGELNDPLVDFRLLRMEFFYYPAYHGFYSQAELALLRQSQLNVAYQIMYHLLVVKEPVSPGELSGFRAKLKFEEPAYIQAQRMQSGMDEGGDPPFYLDHLAAETAEQAGRLEPVKLPVSRPARSRGNSRTRNKRLSTSRRKPAQRSKTRPSSGKRRTQAAGR
ncbi:methyltransferase domain-containing protein [Paenibacillus sp. MMS20-IR301]|uniref:methyltransferase domain-containing protein n=1 Tax=Paenibacillus sp. MMS20-IR301 TaxID=2895946 RepID=UPI0028F0EAEB|nr:methyltransferase domain-containing protein [Paenibacillus sp. MMS20-IR301]WNS45224.1 methyltransferase domain-containing protein [Paenibacillus sp. MMS20-IR301]